MTTKGRIHAQRLLYKKQVMALTGSCYPTVWQWIHKRGFPRPFITGKGMLRRTTWLASEVEVWLANREVKPPKKRRARDPLRVVWGSMLRRCYHPTQTGYARYGGRGITVCREWRESFEAFARDMGPKPGPEYTLDRRDNDGPTRPITADGRRGPSRRGTVAGPTPTRTPIGPSCVVG